ncbi:ABC transporter permease [Bifidobacterium hapali]|uniref:ABC transporter permease n=1 Tax=Bifidobacterium hapali TaxID=1630172 RepID=A0A261G4B4_9BIFI|nr:ABC transporter permease [Bifidobacterium hapali]OZG66252.1 ABC transporter permease [Bifidobacterium hapali]
MFIIRNAWRNVIRNKGRNILIAIIVAIIAAAATIGLAIRQAAVTARETGLENTTITAQISFDRSKAISELRESSNSSDSSNSSSDSSSAPDFDAMREAMSDKQLSLSDYETYAKASSAVKSTYYTETASLAATDDFQPVEDSTSSSTSDSSSDSSSNSSSSDNGNSSDNAQQQPDGDMGAGRGGDMGGMTMTSGDFSLVGFSSDEAVSNAANGTFTMSDGEVFGYDSDSDGNVIISKELADFNNLSVGDTFTVENATDDSTTYTLTVVGIYENDTESSNQMGGPMRSTASDPANAIYTSISPLKSLGLDADSTVSSTDSNGNTTETAAAQLSYTYVFASKDDYETFTSDVTKAGLSDDYTVSSADVEQYESSLVPLNNLAQFALTLLWIVLGVGAVVLVVITLFNVRERKYEVGVLTAIGVKKIKVAAQFTFELLVVTMIGLALGAAGGAIASVPVSNQLLAAQVEQQEAQLTSQNAQFGRGMQGPGAAGEATSGNNDSSSADSSNSSDSAANNAPSQPSGNGPRGMMGQAVNYVSSVNATVSLKVVGQLLLIGLGLTLIAALVAVVFVMRYEPLQILADRS